MRDSQSRGDGPATRGTRSIREPFAARTSVRVYRDARRHGGVAIGGVIWQVREEGARGDRDAADWGECVSPAGQALLTKVSPRRLKGAMARQYGDEKIDLLEALRLLARAELLRYGEFVACLVTATGCSERAGKDAIRILRRGGYVERSTLVGDRRARCSG